MIPASWEPYYRQDDGELIGYLSPDDDGIVPMTLIGTPLDGPTDAFAAEQTLEGTGLSYLADRWLLRNDDGSESTVVLVEIDPQRAVVTNADSALVVGRPSDMVSVTEVPIPTDRLRRA